MKNFVCVILAVKLWGDQWRGKRCVIFCDNDAVCDVITNLRAKDSDMQRFLREFLYHACKLNFIPVVSKIGTKENDIADFISRNYNSDDARIFFAKQNIPPLRKLEISDELFDLQAEW